MNPGHEIETIHENFRLLVEESLAEVNEILICVEDFRHHGYNYIQAQSIQEVFSVLNENKGKVFLGASYERTVDPWLGRIKLKFS